METLLTTQMNDNAEKIPMKIQIQLNKSMKMLAEISQVNSINNKVQDDRSIKSAQIFLTV